MQGIALVLVMPASRRVIPGAGKFRDAPGSFRPLKKTASVKEAVIRCARSVGSPGWCVPERWVPDGSRRLRGVEKTASFATRSFATIE